MNRLDTTVPITVAIAVTALTGCGRCPSSTTSCGDTCLASGATCGGCSSPCGASQLCVDGQCLGTQVATLSYDVQDAKYSGALDRIVIASQADLAVHVYDPRTNDDARIPLPGTVSAIPELFLGLSPDGRKAVVVGGPWIMYVDLVAGTVLGPWGGPSSDANNLVLVGVAIGNDGYAYVFTRYDGPPSYLFSVNLSTGVLGEAGLRVGVDGVDIYPFVTASSDGAHIFFISPEGFDRSLYECRPIGGQVTDLSHSTTPACGTPWVSRDGSRVFTGCGATYGAPVETPDGGVLPAGPVLQTPPWAGGDEATPEESPPIFGLDDPSSGSPVAAAGLDPRASSSATAAVVLALYDPATLALLSVVPSPLMVSGGVSSPSGPYYVFYDASGSTRFELVATGRYPNVTWGVSSF